MEALDVGEDVGDRDTAQGVYDDSGNDPRLLCHDGRRERESEEEEPADAVKPGTMRKPVSPAKFQAMSPHES